MDEIKLVHSTSDIGLGCYGRCGYLDILVCVKNIAYEKHVSLVFKNLELPLRYSHSDEHCDYFSYRANFSSRNQVLYFSIKYEVSNQTFWLHDQKIEIP
jgi:hypothetical protein